MQRARSGALKAMMLAVLAIPLAAAGHPLAPTQRPSRSALVAVADAYLAALDRDDPAAAPIAPGIKFTENGQRLAIGDASWANISRIGDYRVDFVDTQAGQIGLFVTVEENGFPSLLALRLKIVTGRIVEAEHIVARKDEGSFGLLPQPKLNETVPPSERTPRAELVRIANSYFEGLEQETDRLTPFARDCMRIENGRRVTDSTAPEFAGKLQAIGCQAQFATGFSKFVTAVRERRFPVVDEEKQLVYSVIFFDHLGNIPSVPLKGGGELKVRPQYQRPYSWLMGEVFRIEAGRIRQIEAVLVPVPYGMPSGWQAETPVTAHRSR